MVVHNLDFVRVFALPAEAEPPLVIEADAVLALPSAFQSFQPVARRHAQIGQKPGDVQLRELPQGDPFDGGRQPVGAGAVPQSLGFLAGKADDHGGRLSAGDIGVKPGRFHAAAAVGMATTLAGVAGLRANHFAASAGFTSSR